MSFRDKFEHWMELETSYTLGQFSVAEQYAYFDQGVARGEFSLMARVLNYMHRAKLLAETMKGPEDPAGLQLVQALGKTAHNLGALDASAYSQRQFVKGRSFVKRQVENFSDLAGTFVIAEPPTVVGIEKNIQLRRTMFQKLQTSQDNGDLYSFDILAGDEMWFAANEFVNAAETYGWPKPGEPSGYVSPWCL